MVASLFKKGLITQEELIKVEMVRLCDLTGWTYDYVKNMRVEDRYEIMAIYSGMNNPQGREERKVNKVLR